MQNMVYKQFSIKYQLYVIVYLWKKIQIINGLYNIQTHIKNMQSSRTHSQMESRSPRPPRYQTRQSVERKRKQTLEQYNYSVDNSITQPSINTNGQSRVMSENWDVSQIQYTHQQFSPHQNVGQLLEDFQQGFKKLLQIVPVKYQVLLEVCKNKYLFLKQILTHYQAEKHLNPYYFQLHAQSTDTKNHLLKLLNQQKHANSALKRQNQQMKAEIQKMAKLFKAKNDTCQDLSQKLRSLEQQNKQLEQNAHKNQLQLVRFREKIIEKDEKLCELTCNKQKIMQDLNQIEQQMKTLNFISDSESNIGKSKKKIKSAKKIRIKVPSCHKIDDEQKQNMKQNYGHNGDQDLYRFLAIQALTIEQDLYQE